MKYFIAVALIAAVASAGFTKPTGVDMSTPEMAEVQEIIAAINSPSTNPATAAALEQLLQQVLGIAEPEPIVVGPAIVDSYEPISVGPAIIDFPIPESALTPTPVIPSPIVPGPVAPAPAVSSPLVQIVVNVQQAESVAESPVPSPVIVAEEASIIPSPVIVAEVADEQVNVVDSLPVPPKPVIVVEQSPGPVEPVNVAPIVVSPAVVAPEILN